MMLLKISLPLLTCWQIGGVSTAFLMAAALAATASAARAADEPEEEAVNAEELDEDEDETRILIFSGSEDETIFDDVAIGDRVQLLEFEDVDGRKRVIEIKGDEKIVRTFDENGTLLTEHNIQEADPRLVTKSTCVAEDDEGEPVILEWKTESGDAEAKDVEHTVICLTGVDAEPENRVEAMHRAIDQLEKDAKQKEKHRKEMIRSLREQAKQIEKND